MLRLYLSCAYCEPERVAVFLSLHRRPRSLIEGGLDHLGLIGISVYTRVLDGTSTACLPSERGESRPFRPRENVQIRRLVGATSVRAETPSDAL